MSKRALKVKEGGERLDRYLHRVAKLHSRETARKMVLGGKVQVDGVVRRPSYILRGGEKLEFELPQEPESRLEAQDIPLQVLYRDDQLMVINKQAGMVVHPGAGHTRGTMANALAAELAGALGGQRPGIVHRLDKDTSGLLVVARDVRTESTLREEIKARRVSRRYLALVHGKLSGSGLVDAPHGRHPRDRQRFAVCPAKGRPAQTHFRVLRDCGEVSLVECELVTGRTHQIRVHMSFIGHPVLGDKAYGRADSYPRQMLHAYQLAFKHPLNGKQMSFACPLPADFHQVLLELGLSEREIKRFCH